ncbi:hypothetical protein TNCV_3514941 [Trichonephila clavipes]|nr:hypothetical protein TNCV_3514941 [Trichonephila clavipes]
MIHFLHPFLQFLDNSSGAWSSSGAKCASGDRLNRRSAGRDEDHVEEHLEWGIVGGFVNGSPVRKQEKGQFLLPVLLITRYQERDYSGCSD